MTNIPLKRLAHIQQQKPLARIELRFQRGDRKRPLTGTRAGRNPAKAVVINGRGDRRMLAANRAMGIFAELEFAELELERVKMNQASDKRFADAQDQLDCLDRLHGSDHPRQYAQHAAFGAGGHAPGGRRLGQHTAITRSAQMRREDGTLPLEPQNGTVNVRLFKEYANVV